MTLCMEMPTLTDTSLDTQALLDLGAACVQVARDVGRRHQDAEGRGAIAGDFFFDCKGVVVSPAPQNLIEERE